MNPSIDIIRRLTEATPKPYVWRWLLHTALYSCCILVNEHFELIEAMGFSPYIQTVIRIAGTMIYILLTTYSFQKTNNDTDTEATEIPDNMVINSRHNTAANDTSGADDAQGNKQDGPQPGIVRPNPTGHTAG